MRMMDRWMAGSSTVDSIKSESFLLIHELKLNISRLTLHFIVPTYIEMFIWALKFNR